MPTRAPPAAVKAYLAAQPGPQRAALLALREQVLSVIPDAAEKISYGIVGFFHEGRAVVWIAGFREHCSLFPPTVRFAPDKPLPAARVKALVKRRLAENRALAAKKRAKKGPAKKAGKKSAKKAAKR